MTGDKDSHPGMSESTIKLGSISMNPPAMILPRQGLKARVLKSGGSQRIAGSAAQLQMKNSPIFPAGPAMGSIGETETE